TSTHTQEDFDMKEADVAQPGYVALHPPTLIKENWTVSELKEAGFDFIKWPDRPCVITDSSHRAVVVLIGRPGHPDWDGVIGNAASAMHDFREKALQAGFFMDKRYRDNRRGNFYALASGISMGGRRIELGTGAPEDDR
ncbi:hypothetical protein H0H92_001567, partial [Tricholoma furcatifolium]